ncbi:MAG: chitinase [Alphaproteobacteria bacterium]|nr:chitinase [Alphaproteobacteria bacterium]
MRGWVSGLLFLLAPLGAAHAQEAVAKGTVPFFEQSVAGSAYAVVGNAPAPATTTIPTLLVPVILSFDAKIVKGQPFVMDAARDVPRILASPIFSRFAFPAGGNTQYADAMLRASFAAPDAWHTLLGKPEIRPIRITVPAGFGYVLTSKSSGKSLAVVDIVFLQKEIFKQVPRQDGGLVVAVTRNTTYYTHGDATECCAWGTHGIDAATGNSFVLGSILTRAPSVVLDQDVQPLSQQVAQFFKDPLFDPLVHGRNVKVPGNVMPGWLRPASQPPGDQGLCGGDRVGTDLFLLEPLDTNAKNTLPASKSFAVRAGGATYHLQTVALLPWYTGLFDGSGRSFSFPDTKALIDRAPPCPLPAAPETLTARAAAISLHQAPNGHKLIGYWIAYGPAGLHIPLRDVSPQWDVIIVAFATPDPAGPEGTMQFRTPAGMDTAQFKADIAWMKAQGKTVIVSLGGGGAHFTLEDPRRVPNYVASVARIVSEYGFDGVDIDFESPSLSLDPGDTDFRHPTTPSVVNLISAMRQLHDRFGRDFVISLVPEGTQIPSGYPSYGGQFGSYLPIAYGVRDILTFMDTQDYNTPPLEGLDGEIYQPGSVDYHAAVTELVLHGFNVGGDPRHFFPPMPADKIAIGFLTPDTNPAIVSAAMDYLITGKAPPGTKYRLRNPAGYPGLIGAMFWTLNYDRYDGYNYSNLVGPQLHAYPKVK